MCCQLQPIKRLGFVLQVQQDMQYCCVVVLSVCCLSRGHNSAQLIPALVGSMHLAMHVYCCWL